MSECEQQTELRGREAPAVRRTQKQHAKSLFFGLQLMATTLRNPCCSASSRKRRWIVLFRERRGIIAKIAKSEQAAETRHQADQVVVEPSFCATRQNIAESTATTEVGPCGSP